MSVAHGSALRSFDSHLTAMLMNAQLIVPQRRVKKRPMVSITKLAPNQSRRIDEKLRAVLKICQQMNSERDLSSLLDLIAREATLLMGADRASIFLLDRERYELWSKVALGSEETLRFNARLGIAGAALMSGRVVNVTNAREDPRFYSEIDSQTGYRTRNVLAVPLRNQSDDALGVFEVLNKEDGDFSAEDEETLNAIAAQAAIAIETAQMVGDLKRRQDQLLQENTQLWKEVEGRYFPQNILGTSPKIQAVLNLINQISDSSVDVLITGESGTGKELVAKAIHYNSPRARRPFVPLNCAALPENLVESELFGIEKGVATGVERRIGKFEAAATGTLLLDEVGDLSPTAQAKILRVLQERVIERVGGRKAIPVDVRILAATNKDLEAEIKKGTFREDLYYRLKVIHVRTPALREIRDDIPLLANYFLDTHCREMKKKPMSFDLQAMSKLTSFPWPGNVRELNSEIKRLVVTVRDKTIKAEDLAEPIRGCSAGSPLKAGPDQSEKSGAARWSLKELIGRLSRSHLS